MPIPDEVLARQVKLRGPQRLMAALFNELCEQRNAERLYLGVFHSGGSGSPMIFDGTKPVRLMLAEKVAPADARPILDAALDRIAKERGLEHERGAVRIVWPDEPTPPDDED